MRARALCPRRTFISLVRHFLSSFSVESIEYCILHPNFCALSQVLRQELLDSKETTARSDHLNKAVKEKLARDKGGSMGHSDYFTAALNLSMNCTGLFIWSDTWVGLTLIWVFHNDASCSANFACQLCHISMCLSKTG